MIRNLLLRRLGAAVLLGLALAGCASQPVAEGETYDPLEEVNRDVYAFNDGLDRYVLAPAARGWTAVTPQFVRTGVDNFIDNAGYINVILNDFLQGKPAQGVRDTGRFLTNSTIGVLGLFDVATHLGMPAHDEDFGQTLGTWGSDQGAYLMLPAFGPSSSRDITSYPVAALTNVLNYTLDGGVLLGLKVLDAVNTRAQLDKAVKIRDQAALDPYLFTREAWIQHRRQLVYDGNPPLEYYDEFFEDEAER